MDPDTSHVYMAHQRFGLNQTQVGEYELVDNHQHLDIATPHSPSTPDLLYPHTHLTAPANLPINQNGLPVLSTAAEVDEHGLSAHPTSAAAASRPDLDLDLERQHALFYSSDLLNSNISVDLAIGLDDNLSNVGSADHLIHGGHGNFLSVNNSRTFLQGRPAEKLGRAPVPSTKLVVYCSEAVGSHNHAAFVAWRDRIRQVPETLAGIALLPSCTTAWPPACRAPRRNVRVALPRQRSAGTVVK